MLTLVKMEVLKLKRSNIFRIALLILLLLTGIIVMQGSMLHNGVRFFDSPGWLLEGALSWGTFYIFPAIFSLLGTYMISREFQDGTMKILQTIPVDMNKLIKAKLFTSCIMSIILSITLFILILISEMILHVHQLSIDLILGYFIQYLLQGIGIFIAITPIIALTAIFQKSYLLSIVFAIIYSFMGIFAASSKLHSIYPISAVFVFSGAYPVTGMAYWLSCLSLLATLAIALMMLKRIGVYKEKF
ncbi:ABC transporter permease [Paenibacillus albiflavus]|uniref:ABC transporter permease n=1 Tax=Paenibacillus albiflavus TaxID=2545760 RepID=A0A4R4EGF9_9BACL|nr:ABC transporter permease [Paenibacillus albiflavus]TCZ78869.1 ABC transporter permease [Paenibacillus albiflavus]